MSSPTIQAIADELNVMARTHPIGTLQELRGHQPGNNLFRVNAKTTQKRWACHWGGRTELQFNIGHHKSSQFRHGVAFSFERSRTYSAAELVKMLKPKVAWFNKFVRLHPEICGDMHLWAEGRSTDPHKRGPGPIPRALVAENAFVFLGKFQPINRVDYDLFSMTSTGFCRSINTSRVRGRSGRFQFP